jgi:hypothetical protein
VKFNAHQQNSKILRHVTDLPWAQKAEGHRKKLNFVFFK